MFSVIDSRELFSEKDLFAQAAVAGEFVFLAQDGRGSHGAVDDPTAQGQAQRTLENLVAALKRVGLDLSAVVSLTVYLPHYHNVAEVAEVLAAAFASNPTNFPAI